MEGQFFEIPFSQVSDIKMKASITILLMLLCINCISQSSDQYAKSFKKSSSVNDYVNVLRIDEVEKLSFQIDSIEKASNIEFAICLIESLNGYKIKDLATSIGNYWDIGKPDVNNGVLILLSKSDKEVFIATGIGTEKYLTNHDVQEIVDLELIPYLKKGKYYEGLSISIHELERKLNASKILKKEEVSSFGIVILIILIGGGLFMVYDYYKLGGFDKEVQQYKRPSSNSFTSTGSDGGSFDGGGAGGSFSD